MWWIIPGSGRVSIATKRPRLTRARPKSAVEVVAVGVDTALSLYTESHSLWAQSRFVFFSCVLRDEFHKPIDWH